MAKKEVTKKDAIDTRLDRIVWREISHKSVREIAEDHGLNVQDVFEAKRRILESVDSLTIQERVTKMITDLSEVVEIALAHSRIIGHDAEAQRNLGPVLTAATQASKAVIAQMNTMEKATSGQVEKLNQRRINALVTIMQMTVDASVVELDDGKPHTAEEMFAVFNKNMIAGVAEVEARELDG